MNTRKVFHWGSLLKTAESDADLTCRAIELSGAKRDGLLTAAEYAVLCGWGKQRRAELKGQPCGT